MFPNELVLGIHPYGLMIAIGVLLCFLVLFKYAKVAKVSEKFTDFVFYNAIVAIVIGFFFAAVFQGVYNYIETPERGFRLDGGITFIGGLIGGAAAFIVGYLIFRKKFTDKLGDTLNIIPCCIVLAHGFGRIGCFCAGCCYGGPAEGFFSFLGVSFAPGSTAHINHGLTPLYPTQLFEAIFLFILFGVFTYLFFKGKSKGKYNLEIYLISYGVFRFLIEYVRADYRGTFLSIMSPSQFWSVLMIVLGVALLILPKYLPVLGKILYGKYNGDGEVQNETPQDDAAVETE